MAIRKYIGRRNYLGVPWWVAAIDHKGQHRTINPRHDLANHSPDGFSWGYSGSGPALLALALLAHHLDDDDDEALRLYQPFKAAVIAAMDQESDWTLTPNDIKRGIAAADG